MRVHVVPALCLFALGILAFSCVPANASDSGSQPVVWLEAERFDELGDWVNDAQFSHVTDWAP